MTLLLAAVATLAACESPGPSPYGSRKFVEPTEPFSVAQCKATECTITLKMAVEPTGSRCTFSLPAFYLVPKSSTTITWALSFPEGGAQFRFPAGVVPVTVKGTGQRPWTAALPSAPGTSYSVTRLASNGGYATSYGLSLQIKPAGSADWQDCTPLDPIIVNMD